jgi:tetratricopeptide (TPR) repeat protein
MSDVPRRQLVAQRSLLALSMTGLAVFPAAWLISRSTFLRETIAHRGSSPPAGEDGAREALQASFALLEARQAEAALVTLQRALPLAPGNAQLWTNLCVAHGVLGNREEAVTACSRAVALDPFQQRYVNNLAWVRSLPSRLPADG